MESPILTVIDGRPAVVEHREPELPIPPASVKEMLERVRRGVERLELASRAAKKAAADKTDARDHLEAEVGLLLLAAEREGDIEMRLPMFTDEAEGD